MSTVRVRSLTAAPASPEALAEQGRRLASDSAQSLRNLVRGVGELLGPLTSGLQHGKVPSHRHEGACCEIPETECPPRCVCEISWEAAVGEGLRATLRVVNSSLQGRSFDLEATELLGPGGSLGAMTVTPPQLQLGPGRSGLARADLTVPAEAREGYYEGELLVTGAFEQCVRVQVKAVSRDQCRPGEPDCMCEVVQGDPPVRLRAHNWYDHFQCTEPCTPVRERAEV
jgi:hypothetical protein